MATLWVERFTLKNASLFVFSSLNRNFTLSLQLKTMRKYAKRSEVWIGLKGIILHRRTGQHAVTKHFKNETDRSRVIRGFGSSRETEKAYHKEKVKF